MNPVEPTKFSFLLGRAPLPRFLSLTDLAALVIGFATAGYIFRGTILALRDWSGLGRLSVALVAFLWLGVVLSGPFVLALRRLQHGVRGRLSSGESIWIVLGVMWLAVTALRALEPIDPVTVTSLGARTAGLAAGLAPVLIIGLWYVERSRTHRAAPAGYSWCHHAGILCAAAWPIGWTVAAALLCA